MNRIKKYSKLKSDIIALKEYAAERYNAEKDTRIDALLAELNDLLLGIKQGLLYMPYKELRMSSTHSATDGAYDDDIKLKEMIYVIQEDIYSVKKYIAVLAKYRLFSHKKGDDVNWLFPNLKCKNGKIQCIAYRSENMLKISFSNGHEIRLGYCQSDNVYIITVINRRIIEEQRIKLRSNIEVNLQNLILEYENI